MIELAPGLRALPRRWAQARQTRQEQRNSRIEWACRDVIFFTAIAARVSYWMFWTALFLIGAFGNALASRIFFTDQERFFKASLLAAAVICFFAGLATVVTAARSEKELWEAVVRRTVRTGLLTPPDPTEEWSGKSPVVPVPPKHGPGPPTDQ